CPKCGSENKESNESCSSCYASIVDVELTDSTREPMVIPPAPAKPAQPRAAQPSAQQPQGPMHSGPAGPTGPVGHSPTYRERPAPVRHGSKAVLLVFVLVLVAAGAGAGWWFLLRQPSPGEVVQRFLSACEDENAEKAKSFLSKSTLSIPGMAEAFSKAFSFARKTAKAGDKQRDLTIRIVGTSYEGSAKNTAIVTWEPQDKTDIPSGIDARLDWVLVKEEGAWKIDLVESSNRTLRKLLREALKKGLKIPGNVPPGP
ncbi:MAG: zinc ribbon domain-containing protein, partial [Armatimonadota bacterium]